MTAVLSEEERKARLDHYVRSGKYTAMMQRAHAHTVALNWRRPKPNRGVHANKVRPEVASAVLLHGEGDSVFGVTAAHVLIQYFQDLRKRPGLWLRVGPVAVQDVRDFVIDMATKCSVDLATFKVDPLVLSQRIGVPAYRYRERVQKGDAVILGAFRQDNIRLEDGTFFADFSHLIAHVTETSETNFKVQIKTGPPVDKGPWLRVPRDFRMAGGSGGPVFRIQEGQLDGRYFFELEVAGFMYEYDPPRYRDDAAPCGLVVARYVDAVEPSGLLKGDLILPPNRCKVSEFLTAAPQRRTRP